MSELRPATEAGRRILRQDYRGNESYTVTREDILAIEREAVAAFVWSRLESTPGFNEELAQGLADVKAGRVTAWADVKRRLDEEGHEPPTIEAEAGAERDRLEAALRANPAEQIAALAAHVVRSFDKGTAMRVFQEANDQLIANLGLDGPRAVVHRVQHWREIDPTCHGCGKAFETAPRLSFLAWPVCGLDCLTVVEKRFAEDDARAALRGSEGTPTDG